MDVLIGIFLDVVCFRWVNRENNPYRKVVAILAWLVFGVAIAVIGYSVITY
tara:strand:- start:109 stop:261 length:153 start_codon:yes stop_codon:yes gene_type:complete